jgi:hypothetical protein
VVKYLREPRGFGQPLPVNMHMGRHSLNLNVGINMGMGMSGEVAQRQVCDQMAAWQEHVKRLASLPSPVAKRLSPKRPRREERNVVPQRETKKAKREVAEKLEKPTKGDAKPLYARRGGKVSPLKKSALKSQGPLPSAPLTLSQLQSQATQIQTPESLSLELDEDILREVLTEEISRLDSGTTGDGGVADGSGCGGVDGVGGLRVSPNASPELAGVYAAGMTLEEAMK